MPSLLLSDLIPEHAALHRKRQAGNDPYSPQSSNAPQIDPQQAKQAYDIYNYSQGNSPTGGLLEKMGLFGNAGPALNAGGYLGTGMTGAGAAAPAFDIGVSGAGGMAGPAIGDIGLGTGSAAPAMDIGTSGGMFGGKGGSSAGSGAMGGAAMAALPVALFAGGMLAAKHANDKRDERMAEWRNSDPEGYAKEMAVRKERNLQGVIEEQERKKKRQEMLHEENLGKGESE